MHDKTRNAVNVRPRRQAGHSADISSSEITDKAVYRQRRTLIKASVAAGLIGSIADHAMAGKKLTSPIVKTDYGADEDITAIETATAYNNFYELGLDKGDPVANAAQLKTQPWSITVDGECHKPGKLTLEDILKPHAVEERIYRHRCVEAWSMVIPWNGFALADLLKRFEPTGNAKYVAFETIYDPVNLRNQRRAILDWPYLEGLRLDEAMNPLAFLAIGMYGEVIPNQNGAPLRLVLPWKYGYKSIKSIVRISFTARQPRTTWNELAPSYYGFYSNVNPDVRHPRWSQKRERRLVHKPGSLFSLFSSKIDTLRFNGYEEEVGSLYEGMDLHKYF